MSEPFIAEIKLFGGNFAPRSWAFCDGQTIPVAQNTALFSLLGTIYGGNGRTDFALPDLQGRFPMHAGAGAGLTRRNIGARGGSATVTLSESHLPSHSHGTGKMAVDDKADAKTADGALFANEPTGTSAIFTDAAAVNVNMDKVTEGVGGGQAISNQPPYTAIYFVIALQGLFPSRS